VGEEKRGEREEEEKVTVRELARHKTAAAALSERVQKAGLNTP
jgi:hypothetical protein